VISVGREAKRDARRAGFPERIIRRTRYYLETSTNRWDVRWWAVELRDSDYAVIADRPSIVFQTTSTAAR
jgi:hypothetical protein